MKPMYNLTKKVLKEIEKGMQPIIKTLNEKNYGTDGSCEGHTNPLKQFDEKGRATGFIVFWANFKFSTPIPMIDNSDNPDGQFTKIEDEGKPSRCMTYRWYSSVNSTNEQKEKERLEWLDMLNKWANELKPRELEIAEPMYMVSFDEKVKTGVPKFNYRQYDNYDELYKNAEQFVKDNYNKVRAFTIMTIGGRVY